MTSDSGFERGLMSRTARNDAGEGTAWANPVARRVKRRVDSEDCIFGGRGAGIGLRME